MNLGYYSDGESICRSSSSSDDFTREDSTTDVTSLSSSSSLSTISSVDSDSSESMSSSNSFSTSSSISSSNGDHVNGRFESDDESSCDDNYYSPQEIWWRYENSVVCDETDYWCNGDKTGRVIFKTKSWLPGGDRSATTTTTTTTNKDWFPRVYDSERFFDESEWKLLSEYYDYGCIRARSLFEQQLIALTCLQLRRQYRDDKGFFKNQLVTYHPDKQQDMPFLVANVLFKKLFHVYKSL